MDRRRRVALSKTMSHALRHQPWLYELELDGEGWVPLDELLVALRERGGWWASIDRARIEETVGLSPKRRFEINGDRVRALYGHSVPGRLSRVPARPPPRLFHGTAPQTVDVVLRDGLRPMTRQYVHLSADVDTAVQVGSRKAASPVVLQVDAAGAADAGVVFYRGNDHVWLADGVPERFLAPLAA
jgi:putative RNA 2'-phosphotransferase